MFEWLGSRVAGQPLRWALAWGVIVAALVALSPSAEDLARHEPRSLLPDDQPYNQALRFERKAFPQLASRTRTVLIFTADGSLTPQHKTYLHTLSNSLSGAYASSEGWSVQSPFTQPFLRSRLLSADGAAAMIVVNSDTNYLTRRSIRHVETIDAEVRASLPADLDFEITGEGGLGRDLSAASQKAFDRTTVVTLVALLAILALIYRAPLAAFVPLAAIGASVVAAIMLLNQLTRLGWGLSSFEKTIVVVLLFGSGTDFALFWLASFRENLGTAPGRREAATLATARTGPAILSSAATTVCGLLMLMAADLLPSYNAGRALGIALTVSMLAALTLVPALAVLMRGALYWPRTMHAPAVRNFNLWHRLAGAVVARPVGAAVLCVVLLVVPAIRGAGVQYTYEAFGVVPPGSGAQRGERLAQEHFDREQLFSWSCMVEFPTGGDKADASGNLADSGADILRQVTGVSDVWSLRAPLGDPARSALAALAATDLGRKQAEAFYISPELHALRWEIMQEAAPLSPAAMRSCAEALERIQAWATVRDAAAQVHATGLTPYILNVKDVSDGDQVRVMALVIAVILGIVYWMVRDVALAVVMLAGTLGVYAVTLGLTEWFFVTFMGETGIDWKVKLFAFVILVAVGQDYNIFLVSRLLYERRHTDAAEATRRAIAQTGGVISSCGAIMAATLGSLAATGLPFFQELGMAFACGVLVDTFIIRPVFVPAMYLLLRRRSPAGPEPA